MENTNNKENLENRQPIQTELTMLQRIALEGEVSTCYDSAIHEDDKVYFTYILLSCSPEEYVPYYMTEALKYVDEETVKNCYRYVVNGMFPTTLYARKVISDIKGCLGCTEGQLRERLPKFSEETLKSKFVNYIRNLENILPSVLREIFFAIITDKSGTLDFLTEIAFTFNTEIAGRADGVSDSARIIRILQPSVLDMSVCSFVKEIEAVKEQTPRVSEQDIVTFVNSIIENVVKKESNKVFIVNKIDKATHNVVFTKEFPTQDKALNYIRSIGKDYPDILQRYEFVIITQSEEES